MKTETYKKLEVGEYLLLIPISRNEKFGCKEDMLWSHKTFEHKVFGRLTVELVASAILRERAVNNSPFYDIELDMYSPEIYSETILNSFQNNWSYVAMRQTFRYFQQLISKFTDAKGFLSEYRWHSNSHNALSISPLNENYEDTKKRSSILNSVYQDISETKIEELLISIGNCEKIVENYESFTPKETQKQKIEEEYIIQKNNGFFLIKENEIYCGLKSINSQILYKADWRLFMMDMIQYQKSDPGYTMKIEIPNELYVFEDKLFKEHGISNDVYSIDKQIIQIIHAQWKRLKNTYPSLEIIIFESKYDEDKKLGKQQSIRIQYKNKNWETIIEREIFHEYNRDYVLTNIQEIQKSL